MPLLFCLIFSSCALWNPNPNREDVAKTDPVELKPFTTDYCSEWPDGRSNDPKLWADCCFTHDLHYWIGGTQLERTQYDKDLKECVKMTGEPLGSFFMYLGVRIGGHPGNASWAWGYGWTKNRQYFELSDLEKRKARELLKQSSHNKNADEKSIISTFIEKYL